MSEELKHGTWKPIPNNTATPQTATGPKSIYNAQYADTSAEMYLFQSISRLIARNVEQKWMEVIK